jgi:hypothetical protein
MTDAAAGWTVHYPLKKQSPQMGQGISGRRSVFPFHAIHSDCGREFINNALFLWCQENALSFTRGRNGRKNDNCRVEQKNNRILRKTAGCSRSSGDQALQTLRDL